MTADLGQLKAELGRVRYGMHPQSSEFRLARAYSDLIEKLARKIDGDADYAEMILAVRVLRAKVDPIVAGIAARKKAGRSKSKVWSEGNVKTVIRHDGLIRDLMDDMAKLKRNVSYLLDRAGG